MPYLQQSRHYRCLAIIIDKIVFSTGSILKREKYENNSSIGVWAGCWHWSGLMSFSWIGVWAWRWCWKGWISSGNIGVWAGHWRLSGWMFSCWTGVWGICPLIRHVRVGVANWGFLTILNKTGQNCLLFWHIWICCLMTVLVGGGTLVRTSWLMWHLRTFPFLERLRTPLFMAFKNATCIVSRLKHLMISSKC